MCKHKAVLNILQTGDKNYWECLVAHYKPDGSHASACIVCPDCGKNFIDMHTLLEFLYDSTETDQYKWGIEKYDTTQNIWVDAFYSDDLIAMREAMIEHHLENSRGRNE